MKILAIVGSLRKESYNRKLAEAARSVLAENHPDVEFEILDWADVPLMNQDIEYPAPEPVARVRGKVDSADGVWLFSPEYNHFFPGTLKNLLDWLSRPMSETQGQVLAGKPIALAGTTPGMSGTTHAQDHLVTMLSFLQADIMNAPRLAIPHIGQQMGRGELSLASSAPYLEKQAAAFVEFIGKRQAF
ncbi:NADPH-dependent FMN reductase [Raoultibacter phocaeensis]|uniref:NADPH-dependent FMN reductase n=1 Tax=Raoultibacter phocaeensis TaxID=2479841 RepID=UPI00111AD523|nr:NADPH-dependent FMN reductase [Raoultibacter phocaeensis]